MSPLIGKLLALVPPPARRKNALGDWKEIEREFGLELPQDYKEFIEHYGSGVLCASIRIWSPFEFLKHPKHKGPRRGWIHLTGIYTDWQGKPVGLPYPVFPEISGLLPWGVYADVDALAWYTKGEPKEWYTILHSLETEFIELKGIGFADFLLAAIEGKLSLPSDLLLQHVAEAPRTFEPE